MHVTFDGKCVLVTGADHGIGRAIAVAFAERGARVWATGVSDAELSETGRLLGAQGRTAHLDVTDAEGANALVSRIEADAGPVDVLVNNAGGVRGQRGRPVEEVSDADWRDIVAVNLDGTFHCSRAVAPGMKRAGRGAIVNISSGAGLGVSLTGIQAYASAKAGQIGLTRQLAHELGPFGIRVNAIAPGFVLSNPDTERQWARYGDEGQRRLIESIQLRRLGRPDDIAHATLFLASDFASWITGQVLSVNGGR
ncbi:MAG: SDR family NAD(P)-dependent oxidoreductase [Gemmatimonadota bacterium]